MLNPVTSLIPVDNDITGIYRREGTCPLQYDLIRKVLEFIHDHVRFTLTRYGLGGANQLTPIKLSMRAIINIRHMDYYRDVLLGASLREKVWPIVESSAMYDDVVPWLQANRIPRMYNAITVLAANDYGIYEYPISEEEDDDDHDYESTMFDVYEGEWKDGKKEGQGTLTYFEDYYEEDDDDNYNYDDYYNYKALYTGEWKEDKKHGEGRLTYTSGYYEGYWVDDKKSGHGIREYANGDVYKGAWVDDKKQGQGILTYNNDDVYEGNWLEDKKSGKGTLTFSDCGYNRGDKSGVYKGDWLDDKKSGEGTFEYQNNDYSGNCDVYVGSWKDDKYSGQGTLTRPYDDDYSFGYIGGWQSGSRSGQGTQTDSNGDIYVGKWKDDMKCGQGTLIKNGGYRYVGKWKNDMQYGKGIERSSHRVGCYNAIRVYEGDWVNGMKHGQGKFTDCFGKVLQEGQFEHDEFIDLIPSDNNNGQSDKSFSSV